MSFDSVSKTEGDAAGRLGTVKPARPLHAIIKDGARVLITPELAARIANECYYEPQDHRGNSESHIDLLANEMKHGRFSGGTQIHFGRVGDNYFLLDGNHRVRAVARSGKSVEFTLLVDEVPNKKALGPLYWRHDFIQRKRQMVLAAQVSGGINLTQAHTAAALAAIGIIATGFTRGTANNSVLNIMKSPDARLEAFRPWQRHAEQYFGAVSTAPKSFGGRLKRAGYVAVGMATFKYQPEKAAQFWGGVAADDGLRKGDPRKALIRHMTEVTLRGGSAYSSEGFVAAALCWNAFYENRQLSVLKLGAANFYIAGTPIERKFIKRGNA